jgi:hypothetical protein
MAPKSIIVVAKLHHQCLQLLDKVAIPGKEKKTSAPTAAALLMLGTLGKKRFASLLGGLCWTIRWRSQRS